MINRNFYLNKIKNFIDTDLIKVITGMRRCGKTTMLKLIIKDLKNNKQIPEENIFFISFESSKYKWINGTEELDEIIFKLTENINEKIYLLFDEIQNVKGWEKSVVSYMLDINCDIYVTGSNSNLLSGELATHIAGRYIEFRIYPFSFNEILSYQSKSRKLNRYDELELFEEYKEYGGLPYLQQLKDGKIDYINNVYDSILLKDVVSRYDVRDIDFLERLIYFLIDNIGHIFSANSISKFFKHEKRKTNPEKILNYIKLLRNALLFSQVKREDLKGKEILSVNEKYYLMDHGFYKALIGDNDHNEGQKLENIVFNELLRRGYEITVGIYGDLEIDFVCKKNNYVIYVQVSETLKGEITREREFTPLLKIKDNFPKYIITEDLTDYSKHGIRNINIIDFLKDESI